MRDFIVLTEPWSLTKYAVPVDSIELVSVYGSRATQVKGDVERVPGVVIVYNGYVNDNPGYAVESFDTVMAMLGHGVAGAKYHANGPEQGAGIRNHLSPEQGKQLAKAFAEPDLITDHEFTKPAPHAVAYGCRHRVVDNGLLDAIYCGEPRSAHRE